MNLRFALAVGMSGLVCACGSRSDLAIDETFTAPDIDASVTIHDASADRHDAHDAHDAADEGLPIRDAAVDTRDTAPTCPSVCDDDGIACTVDECDSKTATCVHRPDDTLCPAGEKCDGITGCKPVVYALTNTALYEVTLPAGTLRLIASNLVMNGDIALAPNGKLYIAGNGVYPIDRVTGVVGDPLPTSAWGLDGLDVAPDGSLWAASSLRANLQQINGDGTDGTGTASLPDGYVTSGDIAFVGNRLYATAKDGFHVPSDTLVEVGLNGAQSRIIGTIGFPCVWGLATVQSTLYGFTCNGDMITIDTTSGVGTRRINVGAVFNGAASR